MLCTYTNGNDCHQLCLEMNGNGERTWTDHRAKEDKSWVWI